MTFTLPQLTALLPLLITCMTTIVVMLSIAWRRNHDTVYYVSVTGLNLALISLLPTFNLPAQEATSLIRIDNYSIYYMALVLIASLACLTLTHVYLGRGRDKGYPGNREELYLLLLLSTCGALVLVCAEHMASLFIGLELLSVPLYGAIGYAFFNRRSLEAAIKYLTLSASASAFLLFGMALIFADCGALSFKGIGEHLAPLQSPPMLTVLGTGMMLVGLGFKMSLAPFHLWTPDVYEGAPAPVATFLSSVGKVAVFAVVCRLYLNMPALQSGWLESLLAALAVASIVIGNLLALTQNNIKRLLGYSSIAHFGYLLIALIASHGRAGEEALAVYLLVYLLTNVGAFGVISLMSSPFAGRDNDSLFHYRGLFWKRPFLTGILTLMVLSLAGVPITAGFIAKFMVMTAGVDTQLWGLLATMVIGSAIGVFYYLRVMITLFLRETQMPNHHHEPAQKLYGSGVMLLGVAGLILLIGVWPQPLISVVKLLHAAY